MLSFYGQKLEIEIIVFLLFFQKSFALAFAGDFAPLLIKCSRSFACSARPKDCFVQFSVFFEAYFEVIKTFFNSKKKLRYL
jgi:hypothetical protein